MRRIFTRFFVLFLVIISLHCQSKEDNTLRNALVLYSLRCTGGSADACKSSCSGKCGLGPNGSVVTSDKSFCLSSCQSTCSSDCDLSTTLLLYFANNPIR
jgi:hypothetical protein